MGHILYNNVSETGSPGGFPIKLPSLKLCRGPFLGCSVYCSAHLPLFIFAGFKQIRAAVVFAFLDVVQIHTKCLQLPFKGDVWFLVCGGRMGNVMTERPVWLKQVTQRNIQ